MIASLLLIAAVGIGVDVGWRPTSDGRIEYIIQVTPEELQNLSLGDVLVASDVPSGLPPIASYRIVVGREVLPRELPDQPLKNGGQATVGERPPDSSRANSTGYDAQPAIAVFPTEPKQLPNASANVASANSVAENTRETGERPLSSGQSSGPGTPHTNEIAPHLVNSQETSDPWHPIWIIVTCLIAMCLAVTAFTAWVVADYRRKYRQLLAKLAVDPELTEQPPDAHTPSPSNGDQRPQPQLMTQT